MSKQSEVETSPAGDADLYTVSFFSEGFRESRKRLIGVLLLPLIYTSLVFLACLSLYYGSLVSSHDLTRLTVYVVDLDNGFLGQRVVDGIKNLNPYSSAPNWQYDTSITSPEMSYHLILNEKAWAVLQS